MAFEREGKRGLKVRAGNGTHRPMLGWMRREWLAEAAGTGALVLFGTGAATMAQMHPGKVTHGMVSAAFGLAVMACIEVLGGVSGAHINPAVTLGMAWGGRFPWREVPGYVASQLLGAVAGSLAVRAVVGNGGCLGATVPSGGWLQSLGLEWLFTFLLFLAAWRVSGRPLAGVVVGSVVAMEAMVGGPISGASMNPARSLGPAVVSGCWEGHWVYWVGPVLGAACAAWLVRRPWFHDGEGNGNEAG